MENGRRKIRICLICILLAALAAGLCYYNSSRQIQNDVEGVLIRDVQEGAHVC